MSKGGNGMEQQVKQMAAENLGLVHACANRFRGRGVEYEDLFGSGCVGLMKAARHFDPARGFAFSTYAVPVILGEIKRVFRDGGSVKVGRTLKEKARRAMLERQKLETALGRTPTIGEFAAHLGVDVSTAAELVAVSQPVLSLTAEADGETHEADVPVESPEERVVDLLSLRRVFQGLESRDRTLIYLRYFEGLTQTGTAAQLGMSQVQVSRREKAILRLMRERMLA